MFEEELKKKAMEKKKKEFYAGMDFKNLKKDVRDEMVDNAVKAMGQKFKQSAPAETPKRGGMINSHTRRRR